MKICLISRKFNKESGSAEWIYADRLSEELPKKGFKIYKIEQKTDEKSKIKKVFHDFLYTPLNIIYLRFFEDIKLFQFMNENQAIFSFLARITRAKTITYFHDFMRITGKKMSLDKIYFLFAYKMASLSSIIICNSSLTKKDFLRFYNKSDKQIRIIPAIHHKNLFPSKKNKKKLKVVGYLGALTNRKRVLKLADLAIEIKKSKLNLKIEIWGRGYLDKEIIKISKKENLHKIIKLKGMAPYEKMNKIYNSFDFFVFPTEEEGLGLPIIEAMMCGLPVFVLEDSKIPTEVKKECIICKNPRKIMEKIAEFEKNKKKYKSKSLSVFEYSKRFNFNANLNNLIKLYKELK